MKKILLVWLLLLFSLPIVVAQFSNPVSSDTAQFDEILQPIFKIYNFV